MSFLDAARIHQKVLLRIVDGGFLLEFDEVGNQVYPTLFELFQSSDDMLTRPLHRPAGAGGGASAGPAPTAGPMPTAETPKAQRDNAKKEQERLKREAEAAKKEQERQEREQERLKKEQEKEQERLKKEQEKEQERVKREQEKQMKKKRSDSTKKQLTSSGSKLSASFAPKPLEVEKLAEIIKGKNPTELKELGNSAFEERRFENAEFFYSMALAHNPPRDVQKVVYRFDACLLACFRSISQQSFDGVFAFEAC